jgi:membrane fusion protein (multidrug efflux system)
MLRRRMLIMLAVVLLIVLILGGIKAFSIYKQVQMFSQPKPPVSVAAAQAELRQWQSACRRSAASRPTRAWN